MNRKTALRRRSFGSPPGLRARTLRADGRFGMRRGMAVAAIIGVAAFIAVSTAFGLRAGGESHPRATEGVLGASKSSSQRHALPTQGIGVIRLGEEMPQGSGYGRYAYVILDRAQARHARRFPGKVLVYMSGTEFASFDTGVSLSTGQAHHWVLHDSSGNVIAANGYEDHYLADVGNSDYQQRWLRNVLAYLKSTGAGGVFIDNVIADPRGWSAGQVFPTTYPDEQSWSAAMLSFVKAVGPALKSHGYYVLVNANGRVRDTTTDDSSQYANWWRELAPYVSGFMDEYWQQNPTDVGQLRSIGTAWYQDWSGWERLVSVAQSLGVDFFGLTYGSSDDLATMRFGKGSFMLDWNGKGGAFIFNAGDGNPYNEAWTSDLGRPLRKKVQVQPGVWQRQFEHGLVFVNTTTSSVTIHVGTGDATIGATDALFVGTHGKRP